MSKEALEQREAEIRKYSGADSWHKQKELAGRKWVQKKLSKRQNV